MPILVVAKLDRNSGIYLAGEAIKCKVTVTNTGDVSEESLAWGSVHVQCERIIRARKHEAAAQKSSVGSAGAGTTAMSRSAFTVFSCRPVILFCELALRPKESHEFECSQQLPLDSIPPSFRGHLVRYVYKLTVGVQHVRSPIKLTHIPLRIIQADLGVTLPTAQISTNPFIANHCSEPSVIDLVTEAADCLTAPQGTYSFSMKSGTGRLGRFILYKKAFKLGEDVIGRFDFGSAEVRCLQFAVSLQTVESLVNEEWCPRSNVVVHVTERIVCAFWKDAVVRLNIPLSASPTFYTDTVHLKWRLHFEFVIASSGIDGDVEEGIWQAPVSVDIETMAWDLDIKVYPCSPHNVALSMPVLTPAASIVV